MSTIAYNMSYKGHVYTYNSSHVNILFHISTFHQTSMSCHAISTLGVYDQNFSNFVSTKFHFLECDQIIDSKSFSKSLRTRESEFGRERYGRPKLECNKGHTIAPIHAIVCPRVARTFWQLPYTQVFNQKLFWKQPFRLATTPSHLRL